MSKYIPDLTQETQGNIYNEGGQIGTALQNRLQQSYGLQDQYRGQSDQLYQNLQDQPGYSAQQASDIQGTDRLNALQLTPDQLSSNYLTGDETNSILGDPNQVRASDPRQQLDAVTRDSSGFINGALQDQRNGTSNAYSGMVNNTRAAIDPSKLGLSSNYTNSQNAALSGGASGVRVAAYNPDLQVSNDYKNNYQFGPQDQEQMALDAERSIGAATRSKQEDVARAAAASGGVAPLALAAGYNRLQQQGDINSEDAAIDARVKAKQLGLDVTQGRENTLQAAAGRNAQLQTGAEQGLMSTNLSASQAQENARIAAQQYLTGTQLGNETNLGQTGIGIQQQYGQQNVAAQQDIANRAAQVNEYEGTLGTGAAEYIDTNTANRALTAATNRQGVNQANQASQYQRGTYADTANAQRYSQVANQGLAGQQEARGYYTGQGAQYGNQGTTQQGQQIGLYGTKYGLLNQSVGTQANYDLGQNAQSFGNQFSGAFAGALGRTLGGANAGKGGG